MSESQAVERQPSGAQRNAAGLCLNPGLFIALVPILAVFVVVHRFMDARFDFGIFYYAAHMILEGSRHALYDFSAQHAYQLRFHRPTETLFRNPPFALLPILPLAKLPMLAAYTVWTAISFALLFIILKVLEIETDLRYGNWPMLLSLAYLPVMGNLLHGQFSLLMLAAFVFAHSWWSRERLFTGGLMLSIATWKFQLLIGFVAVLLLKRKWRELAGFAVGSAFFFAVSIAIAGVPALMQYPSFVLHSDNPISELSHMANWQGLLWLIGLNRLPVLLALSIITVLWAARAWTDLNHGFAAAMLAAMLVSYHFTLQDITLTIAPFYISVKTGILPRARVPQVVVAVMVVPMIVAVVRAPLALLAIPIALALWWVGRVRPRQKHSGPPHATERIELSI